MVSGDTAAAQAISGWIRNEKITLATYPAASTSTVWTLTIPSGSNAVKSAISDTSIASPTFTPDVGGTYVITALVDGTTTYVLRATVLDTAASEPVEALRYTPRADAQISTPSLGVAVFYSTTQDAWSLKNTAGTVAPIMIGNPTTLTFAESASAPANVAGRLYWFEDNLNLCMGGEVVRQLGEEVQLPKTRNNTGGNITNGTAVYLSGALGSQPTIGVADKANTTASDTIAIATEDIDDNASGYVTSHGIVRGINTATDALAAAVSDGDEIYLSSTGGWQVAKPTGTDMVVSLGRVIYAHATQGLIFVNVQQCRAQILGTDFTEARPLAASTSYSDLKVWSWTDLYFDARTGDRNQAALTVEEYRDTPQLKGFVRHDRDNELHLDYQMPHEWAGTAVNLHVHLIPMANGSGDAYFSGQYVVGGNGDELPANASWTPISAAITLTAAEQYKKQYRGIATLAAPASPGASDVYSVYLQREGLNVADTYTTNKDHGTGAANVCIESVDIHYQRLLMGSEEPFSGSVSLNPTRFFFDPDLVKGDHFVWICAKCDSGNACSFRLWDVTDGDVVQLVAGGDAETTNITGTTYAWYEIGPVTFDSAMHEYRIQGKYNSTADEPKVAAVKLVVR
jgi:hypothetical protein